MRYTDGTVPRSRIVRALSAMLGLWFAAILMTGCGDHGDKTAINAPESPVVPAASLSAATRTLRIVSGSENATLAPIVERWGRENHVDVQLEYKGSVDIMRQLQGTGPFPYDGVWTANSLWTALGDRSRRVKDEQSIFWSPVAFVVKKSVAQRLGWVDKRVTVEDILQAAASDRLRFMMTSATQSNSGASAYLGFLYAFAGSPQTLSVADLKKPQVVQKITSILGAVDRSAGSSGWLKDLFLQQYDHYDALVNYEAVLIETNQELSKSGREPLYIVYPADGLAVADSPLAFVDNGDTAKEKTLQDLEGYLLSDAVQKEILALGRRVGPVGSKQSAVNPAVFNPAWGVRTDEFLNQIRYPKTDVIREALDLYQSTFRKPSLTIYCLDYSGSMKGSRNAALKSAIKMILNQDQARENLLQASPRDDTVIVTFSDHVLNEWRVKGNDSKALDELYHKVDAAEPKGGTDIYTPLLRAFDICREKGQSLHDYFPAVILMTDGESNVGKTMSDLTNAPHDIPVFGIQFGEASQSQLKEITDMTSGRTFDGRTDLAEAFRSAKGYN